MQGKGILGDRRKSCRGEVEELAAPVNPTGSLQAVGIAGAVGV